MLRLAAFLAALLVASGAHAAPLKVLRVPFLIAETNFDSAMVSDEYSGSVCEEIFEPPLTYDFLARPDLEGDRVDGLDVPGLAPDQALRSRPNAGLPLGDLEDLRKLGDVDD